MNRKELAKFLSGFVAFDLLNHLWFESSGLLPVRLCPGLVMTRPINRWLTAMHAVLCPLLIYYAWFKKDPKAKIRR